MEGTDASVVAQLLLHLRRSTSFFQFFQRNPHRGVISGMHLAVQLRGPEIIPQVGVARLEVGMVESQSSIFSLQLAVFVVDPFKSGAEDILAVA